MEYLIKNDVFLNQNNGLSQELNAEDMTLNILSKEFFRDRTSAQELAKGSDAFSRLMDDFSLNEDNDSELLFGCVCCDSCRLESKQLMKKTSHMLEQFRQQMCGLKSSVRQQMSDINTQMNDMRLKFAKLFLDLQIKLNKKNYQLDKILDISRVLQQTNDYLLVDNKQMKKRLENVCKENIKYRNRLGIDLKVVLNRKECHNYIKQMTIKKRLKKTEAKNSVNNVKNNVMNAMINSNEVKEKKKDKIKAKIESTKEKTTVSQPIATNQDSNQCFISVKSHQNSLPLESMPTFSPPKPLIIHYDAIPSIKPSERFPQNPFNTPQPNATKKLKELSFFENQNSIGINVTKIYNKTNNTLFITDNRNLLNQEVFRQRLVSNINGYHNKYHLNRYKNFLDKNNKKPKLDNSTTDSSHCNGVAIKAEPQNNSSLEPLFPKNFSEHKDRNK